MVMLYLRMFLVGCLLLCTGSVYADCGSVPFYAIVSPEVLVVEPSGPGNLVSGSRPEVKFDPLKVTVFEPRQRALIAWNGKEEILLLSTDQRASQQSSVLEVIPLPARPTVRLGDFKTFELAQQLVVNKHMWACAHGGAQAELIRGFKPAGRIEFEQKMGAHQLTVAQVLDRAQFIEFVQQHLRAKYGVQDAPIRPEFAAIIQGYLDDGFRWFAFDVIELGEANRSREPIEYRFASDTIFYPLRISRLEEGPTELDLLIFAPAGTRKFQGLPADTFKRAPVVDVTADDLRAIDPGWADFLMPPPSPQAGPQSVVPQITMERWQVKGESREFAQDVRVK